ncbi:MAG TPA: hypothetical protein VLB67_13685, partial [Acidimicrobiia bacterium]|nr:hypothetical protein [Acidimicrobiia bacterium]
ALVMFLLVANGVLVHYSKGVARTAVDEAVRVAAVHGGDPAVCSAAAQSVLDELLSGTFGRDLKVRCLSADGVVSASVEGRLPAVLHPLPSFEVDVVASAVVSD